jgi:putative Holliday junction resolvase
MTGLSLWRMARILGIDYGTKRVGVAVTDPMQIIVQPLETVPTSQAVHFLKEYTRQEKVELLVCGKPDARYSDTLAALDAFILELQTALPELRIVFQDEDLTSQRASGIILHSGAKRMQRRDKSLVDQVSAVLILQEYLGHLNDMYKA